MGNDKFIVRAKDEAEALSLLQAEYEKNGYKMKVSPKKDYRYNLQVESIKQITEPITQIANFYDDQD
jgi:hypothetical protein